jgi:hypothetical protein
MKNFSRILEALKVLGPDRIHKLSEVLLRGQMTMKKAVGESFESWSGAPEKEPRPKAQPEGKVLPFKKPQQESLFASPAEPPKEEESSTLMSSDFLLWQRDIAKSKEAQAHKKEAVQGYKQATDMYIVKTPTIDGKEKIRFASTNGILVNKKQA